MFGTGVEFFFQKAGVGPLRADYLMGEDVLDWGPIRSLEFPQRFVVDPARGITMPDHFSRRLRFAIVTAGSSLNFVVPLGFAGTDFFCLEASTPAVCTGTRPFSATCSIWPSKAA